MAVVAGASWLNDPHDVDGSLPPSQGALLALGDAVRGVPDGEWHTCGRTGYGQRYSPLAQLTPANVAGLVVAWQYHTGDLRGRLGDPVETSY